MSSPPRLPAADGRNNLLMMAPKLFWPLNTGARLRNYHLARELSRAFNVTYLGFFDQADAGGHPAEDPADAVRAGEVFCREVVGISRNPGHSPLQIVQGVLGATPLPVLKYKTKPMARALADLLDQGDFDVVQVESLHLVDYVPIIRAARSHPVVVCDWHNIESELMTRYSQHAAGVARKTYARLTAQKLRAMERRSTGLFDAHIVVSERDRECLLQLVPDMQVFVVPNGVAVDQYAEPPQADGVSRRIVFVGSMDYHANVDGALWFAREVWPAIHRANPELIFTIVGRDPGPEIRRLAARPGIEVTGTVADVRPYYQQAAASIVPLRVGGGSRLKILESMAAGVPVISTALGAEGLDTSDGQNLLIANTAADFAGSIRSVMSNPKLRLNLIRSASAFVHGHHDWEGLGELLSGVHRSLLEGRTQSLPNQVASPALANVAMSEA